MNFTLLGQLVSTRPIYSTAAAQNRSLLKIRPRIGSCTQNFTFLRHLGVNKEIFNVLRVFTNYAYLFIFMKA